MQALNNNKLAWSLVEQAVAAGASDLHLEPMRNAVRVRIRVDGLLRELVRLPLAAHSTLVTQLKVAANMDIAEKRVPQDGRIALELDGRSVDLRLSTLPTTLGEKIAIRLWRSRSFCSWRSWALRRRIWRATAAFLRSRTA